MRTNAATGLTPSEALLGAPLVRPGEWHHPEVRRGTDTTSAARERRLQQVRDRQTAYARNLFPFPREAPKHFIVGDQVLVRAFPGVQTPFGPPWSGPHLIVAVRGDGTYEVDRNGKRHLIHIDDLRAVPEQHQIQPPPEPPSDDEGNQPQPVPVEPQPGPSTRPPDPREHTPIGANQPVTPSTSAEVPEQEPPPSCFQIAKPRPKSERSVGFRIRGEDTQDQQESAPPLHQVRVEDISEDPEDPGEARPVPGLIPIVGLYP